VLVLVSFKTEWLFHLLKCLRGHTIRLVLTFSQYLVMWMLRPSTNIQLVLIVWKLVLPSTNIQLGLIVWKLVPVVVWRSYFG
jgi:hypothetical protein